MTFNLFHLYLCLFYYTFFISKSAILNNSYVYRKKNSHITKNTKIPIKMSSPKLQVLIKVHYLKLKKVSFTHLGYHS